MITIENKFDVGEKCYTLNQVLSTVECSICDGKGSFIYRGQELHCTRCHGVGMVHGYPQYEVQEVTIKKITITVKNDKPTILYRTDSNTHNKKHEDQLYKDYNQAKWECDEHNLYSK